MGLQEDFVTNHLILNNFIFAPNYEFESKEQIEYPLLLVDIDSSNTGELKTNSVIDDGFTFDITIADLVTHDRSNELEVLSDCKLMLNDFIAYFRQQQFADWLNIDTATSMTPVRLSGTDLTSGWTCKINFKIATDLDLCGIPMVSAPSVGTTPSVYNIVIWAGIDEGDSTTVYTDQYSA